MRYNWQQSDWPNFRYQGEGLTDLLLEFVERAGRVGGFVEGLPENLGTEAVLDLMIAEAIRTSAIEGETLPRDEVMSSIRNRLGLNPVPRPVASRMADGVGELMVAVRNGFREPLTEESLFGWQRILLGGVSNLRVGGWRVGGDPMQVVSGRIVEPTVHFEAPPAARVPEEMAGFIEWFNATAPGGRDAIPHAPIRAAIAHLFFETIHPFEDGNGRIGRALTEKALSQGLGRPVVMSLSRSIDLRRSEYYAALNSAQMSNEVTAWLHWFVGVVVAAQRDAERQIHFIVKKSKFFQRFGAELNERQRKVVARMFDAGPDGFVGGMSARKFVALTGVSKATATRDLQQLVEMGALASLGSGRGVRYELVLG